ncbi:MAG: hypothetical protein ACREB8_15270 [Pseudolabrys sp.]
MTPSIPHIRKTIAVLALALAAGALAGCETVEYPAAPQAAAAPDAPMTHSRAATECWMATEKGHADINLDKRADIVTKCIADKMKAAKG